MAALALCAAQAVSLACTIVISPTEVGSSFRVRVMDRGRPVAGLAVRLSAHGVVKRRAVTNRDGVVRFVGVPAGMYDASPDHPAGALSDAHVSVIPAKATEAVVPMRWPAIEPLVVRSINGVLLVSSWDVTPQPEMALELLEHMTGRVLHQAQTDGKGAFRFPDVPHGPYFLRIQSFVEGQHGFIPVEVRPEADSDALRLALFWTSCGMFHADQSQCPQHDLRLTRLSGSVAKSGDGALIRAAIVLLDEGDREVHRTRSDTRGLFGPVEPAAGRYRLRVDKSGFTPLETPVTIDPKGDQRPLEVKLGVMGACSTAKLR